MATVTKYTYSIADDTANGKLSDSLTEEVHAQGSGVAIQVDHINTAADVLDIYMKDIMPDDVTGASASLAAIVSAHAGIEEETLAQVTLNEEHSSDNIPLITTIKSYRDKSKSFTTPDFCNRQTWFFDKTQVEDEVMTTSDNTVYTTIREQNDGWSHDWLNSFMVPNHIRQSVADIHPIVKKNDVVVTTGFSINYTTGTVTFDSANESGDVVKVSYYYGNSSRFDVTPTTGKKLLIDYIETQFSAGCTMAANSKWIFQAIYNGSAVPTYNIPANTDVPLSAFEYFSAKDFLNESNEAYQVKAFMELTSDVNILPWKYLTGHTLKPAGDATTDISKNEFNKLRIQYVDLDPTKKDPVMPTGEIATGTVYCNIKDL